MTKVVSSSKYGKGIILAFVDSNKQKVTLSSTLTKPDSSNKYVGSFQVCETQDEEIEAIQAQVSESDDGEVSIFIHCLFRKENLYSLYALLKASVTQSPDLEIERVVMFGFPVYASKMVTDVTNETVIAYNHKLTYNSDNANIKDYYVAGSNTSSREVILMGVDTEGLEQG